MVSIDEVWLVDFGEPFPGEPGNIRPAVVIGPPETFLANFPLTIVCPTTTTDRGLSLHVEVEAGGTTGLDQTSYVQCELLRAINIRRLLHRLGSIDSIASDGIDLIVRRLLDH